MNPSSSKKIATLADDHVNSLIRISPETGKWVDWERLAQRLDCQLGKQEVRDFVHGSKSNNKETDPDFPDWGIGTEYEKNDEPRTFIHVLCGLEYTDNEDGKGSPPEQTYGYFIDDFQLEFVARIYPGIPEKVAIKTISAYEGICKLPDGGGKLPLHVLLDTDFLWSNCRKRMFTKLYNAAPDSVKWIVTGNNCTALHLALNSGKDEELFDRDGGELANHICIKKDIVLFLLGKFPEACSIQSRDGRLPLHIASKQFPHPEIITEIIRHNPLAARVPLTEEWFQTPLHFLCREPWESKDVNDRLQSIHAIIKNQLPSYCLSYKVLSGLWKETQDPYDENDVFDHLCLRYAEACTNLWTELDIQHEYKAEYPLTIENMPDGYEHNEIQLPPIWPELLEVLRQMQETKPPTPLHSLLQGRTFRPWHYLPFLGVVSLDPKATLVQDENGNLPLHLLLTNYSTQASRAYEKGFVEDEDEYKKFVDAFFNRLMIGDNKEACKRSNRAGDLPLHLALKADLPYDTVIKHIVEAHKDALLVKGNANDPRDWRSGVGSQEEPKVSGLYPFALAAVGPTAKADSVFKLLETNPAVISLVLEDAAHHLKRKHTNDESSIS